MPSLVLISGADEEQEPLAAPREVQWVMPAALPAMPSALEVIPGVTVEVGPSTFQGVVSLTFRITFLSSTSLVAKQFPAWGVS